MGHKGTIAKPKMVMPLANSFALAEVPAGYDCFPIDFFVRSEKRSLRPKISD